MQQNQGSQIDWRLWIDPRADRPDDPPIFKNIPLSVAFLLGSRGIDESEDDLIKRFPGLTREHLAAVHAYLAEILRSRDISTITRVAAIESWRDDIERDFDATTRSEVRELNKEARVLKRIILLVGLGTVGVVGITLYNVKSIANDAAAQVQISLDRKTQSIQQYIDEKRASIEQSMKQTLDNEQRQLDGVDRSIKEEVKRRVTPEFVEGRAIESAKGLIQGELAKNLDEFLSVYIDGMSASVDSYLASQLLKPQDVEAKFFDPDQMQELAYSVRGISRRYGGQASFRSLPVERRDALMAMFRGVLERALGHRRNAVYYYTRSLESDPTFPDVKILLARTLTEVRLFDPAKKQFVIPNRKKAISLLQEAIKANDIQSSPEVEMWRSEISLLEQNYSEAVQVASNQIDHQK